MQSSHSESFYGRLRKEFLNMAVFRMFWEALCRVGSWQKPRNQNLLHSSFDYRPINLRLLASLTEPATSLGWVFKTTCKLRIADSVSRLRSVRRRDYFRISALLGSSVFGYANCGLRHDLNLIIARCPRILEQHPVGEGAKHWQRIQRELRDAGLPVL